MSLRPEQALENSLIAQLVGMGYERFELPDQATLDPKVDFNLAKVNKKA